MWTRTSSTKQGRQRTMAQMRQLQNQLPLQVSKPAQRPTPSHPIQNKSRKQTSHTENRCKTRNQMQQMPDPANQLPPPTMPNLRIPHPRTTANPRKQTPTSGGDQVRSKTILMRCPYCGGDATAYLEGERIVAWYCPWCGKEG